MANSTPATTPHWPNSAIPAAASSTHDPAPMTAWMKRSVATPSPNTLYTSARKYGYSGA